MKWSSFVVRGELSIVSTLKLIASNGSLSEGSSCPKSYLHEVELSTETFVIECASDLIGENAFVAGNNEEVFKVQAGPVLFSPSNHAWHLR